MRGAVKGWMVASFGSASLARKWSTRMLKDQPGLREYRVSVIREHALKQYPALAAWGTIRRNGHIATWADLMWQESKVVMSTMERLMREHAVPSLSVHDSLIVPASKAQLGAKILTENFNDVTRKQPILIVKQKGQTAYQWQPTEEEQVQAVRKRLIGVIRKRHRST